MDIIHTIISGLKYKVLARHRKGHRIHSPYAFRFVNQVIFEKKPYYAYSKIEKLRKELRKNNTIITTPAIGTQTKNKKQKIKYIAKTCSKPTKQAQLLHRICTDMRAETIVELGTNLGITSLYLAHSNTTNAKVYTFEGSDPLIKIAKENFKKLNCNNINIINGNIDNTLPLKINELNNIDFAFFDANHQYNATINYYNICKTKANKNTIFVFDDIHKNPEMEQAWKEIITNNHTTLSMDLYHLGIVWFDKNLPKRNFIIAY